MAQEILTTSEWYNELAEMISHSRDREFPHLLSKACEKISHYDSILITAYPRDQRPVHIYNNTPPDQISCTLTPYFAGAYLLDPFYALCQNQAPSGIYRLRDLAPDGFYESEYFRNYYADTELRDEAGILIRIDPDLYVLASLGLREEPRPGNPKSFTRLQTITPTLVALCKQFWAEGAAGMEMSRGESNQPCYGASLDRTFLNFGRAYLSERECEVVRLILKGHSSKSIARVLDISPDTVKVHRKRFHAKLQITSQAELFSLFLDAIALAPIGSDEDPLSFYFAEHPLEKVY